MLTVLHFADAHIDMAGYGRHDPTSGLPVRVLDFLKALDTIIDTAISRRVDLVIFAGDAYKDRTPVPTFQREWGRRIMRLSQASIPTILLVGNHDLSPAAGRANALQEFDTLQVPFIHVVGKPCFLQPADLDGLPVQVLALPWVSRSNLMALIQMSAAQPAEVYAAIEDRLNELVQTWLSQADASLPVILTAHASVQGALYGGERSVMLGGDLVLPGSMVKDRRLDYVALGHIHKAQNLNPEMHPPVIYPGSIEKVDFGEVNDDKFFVIAKVERGKTQVEWCKLQGRRYMDCSLKLKSSDHIQQQILDALPSQGEMADAIIRLTVDYPREWENMIDDQALREYAKVAFEFHLVRRPQMVTRLRLPDDRSLSSLLPLELLDLYWKTINTRLDEVEQLHKLAAEIVSSDQSLPG
ncbi:MAG TPA: exonuclease SbcCD subunit D [Anaerolineaceae bacterium]|nr:exonuclease SbcCD subunit D [Anaerolineaceae bacterium]